MKILVTSLAFLGLSSLAFSKTESSLYLKLTDANAREGGGRTFTVEPLAKSGGCPHDQGAQACEGISLALPLDCDWECQEGLLSFQGSAILKGRWNEDDPNHFHVEAGFDTWRKSDLAAPFYSIRGRIDSCDSTSCRGQWEVTDIQRSEKVLRIKKLDFSKADDTNYRLTPSLAKASLEGKEGLIVTARRQGTSLKIRDVFRQWTPSLICVPSKSLIVHLKKTTGGGEGLIIFPSEDEAIESGLEKTPFWAIAESESATKTQFLWGQRELWSQRVSIDKVSCQVEILDEHF